MHPQIISSPWPPQVCTHPPPCLQGTDSILQRALSVVRHSTVAGLTKAPYFYFIWGPTDPVPKG